MKSNSTAILIKIKLRHSLGRPSRSDFVQSMFGEVIILEQIIEYIKRNYNPISVILYGSYADGTNNLNSDFVQIFDGKIIVDSNERGKALQMKVISHIQNRPQKSKAEIDAISLFWSEKDIEMDGAKSPYCICSLQNST